MRDKNARQLAREAGDKYYTTGNPCKWGHESPRATISGSCLKCIQLAGSVWAKENKEKTREYSQKHRDANRDKVREQDRLNKQQLRRANPGYQSRVNAKSYRKRIMEIEGREVRDRGRLTVRELQEEILLVHGEGLKYAGGYIGKTRKALFECTKHNVHIESIPHNVVRGANPCPKCNHTRSRGEEEIADFLSQYTLVERRNRTLLAPKEIDLWLPEFNTGVEFHGLYWHTAPKVGGIHRQKWEMAEKAGIRLVQVFEDEWVFKQDIVKNRLLAFIGQAPSYHARKLQLRQLTAAEAKSFLESTHIQGAGPNASLRYGLFLGDGLVAVATFGKSRSGAMTGAGVAGEWEVMRYASTGRVRGGFSKMFKQFLREASPTKVTSYCDLRYGTGGLYKATGFVLDAVTEPDYWWVPRGEVKRVPRYATQKHKIAKPDHPLFAHYAPGRTENDICHRAGWEKIYGVGNQKWVYSCNLT